MGFYYKKQFLFCEALRVKDIAEGIPQSPFYLYSLAALTDNYQAYTSALDGVSSVVSYAFKANGNLTLLEHLCKMGAGAALVSGNELELARAAGFDPARTVLNGNGKTSYELELAARRGVMVNIDSDFDLEHIERAARVVGKRVPVLIRINPDLDPQVHPYVSTGIRDSKFGIRDGQLSSILDRIEATEDLELVGVHCHLGSTITDVDVFRDATELMMKALAEVRRRGFDASYLNIGGGLGIDYERRQALPTPSDLIDSIRPLLTRDVTLIVEPGRSIVGSAGILVSRVIGVKDSAGKRFIVVDASMTELIRPSLYDAYHHIDFVEPVAGKRTACDIVGPVCESADFLGKARKLASPAEGVGLAVHDAGAYGYAMSSNYNARPRPAEYLVDRDQLTCIRRAEGVDDFMRLFDVDNRNLDNPGS